MKLKNLNPIISSLKKYIIFMLIWPIACVLYMWMINKDFSFFENSSQPFASKGALLIRFLKMAVISPLLEELAFRLALIPKKSNQIIGLVSSFLIFPFYLEMSGNSAIFYYSIISLVWGFYLLRMVFIKIDLKVLIYSSSILFGVLHLLNYSNLKSDNFHLFLFFILPQIFSGYLMAQLRVNHSFKMGFALHCFINIVAFSFGLVYLFF